VFAVYPGRYRSIDILNHSARVGPHVIIRLRRWTCSPPYSFRLCSPGVTLAPKMLVMSETIRDSESSKKTREHAPHEPDCAKLLELVKQINALMTEEERRKQQLLFGPPRKF